MPQTRPLALLALGTALSGLPAAAEMSKSLNLNGATGLIDMPSGEAQEDARFTFSTALIAWAASQEAG